MGIDAPSATTVLVVDPDTLSRALLVAALRQDGHDVAEAAGGREALRLLRERRFDAAVTELTLARPGRDGFRLLRRIRADPTLRRIPLLVVSEAAQMGTVLRCQRLGACAHLAKPFDPVQLRRRVRAALAACSDAEDQPPVPAPPPSPAAAHLSTASSALPPIDPAGQGTFGFVRSLTRWLRPYRRPVVLFCALLTLSMAIASAFPLGFKLLADRALLQHDLRALVIILAVLGIAELVCAAADLWRDHLLGRITHRVLNDMRFGVLRALQRLSLGFYGRVSAGEITSRFTTDVASVENGLHTTLPLLLCQCVLIPCQLVLLFLLEWRLALLVTVGLYLSYRSERWVEPHAERAGHQARADQAVLTSALEENIQAQPVVKMFRLQGVLIELAKRHLLRLSRTAGRATFLSYQVFRLPNRLNSVLNVVVLAVGAWLVFAGKMTLGSLVSFQLLLSGLALAAAELTTCLPPLLQAGIGLQRIQQLLEQPEEVRDDPAAGFLPRPKSAITLNDVSFGYTADRLNLSGVSMTVPLGQSVMLVGPSGCGKSTVLNLLMRLYDPRSGSVCVDGIDLRTITQDSLREQLGVVLQENFLFNTSVRENIRIGRREATDEEVEAAARTAEIHEAILKLPGGYDCVVGERGGKLSGGQRQRVAIARALLSDPAVLLLDEATSALDPATADSINRSLARISEGRTVFSVTHRLESAPAADCVFVFRDGRLVEQGPHQELLAANGLYAVLWRKQNGFSLSADGDRARVQAARLRDIPILAALDDATLATVADLFVTERFGPKRLIVQQGDAADRFYIIVRGRVAISKTGPSGAEETLPPLEDGDHFGEIALIKRSTRTATVRTITDCVFLTLQAEHFLRLVDADAGLRQKMDQVIEERP